MRLPHERLDELEYQMRLVSVALVLVEVVFLVLIWVMLWKEAVL